MKRIYVPGPLEERMEIGEEAARHIGLSLRMAVGNLLGVIGQDGRCGEAEIVRIAPEKVVLELKYLTDSHEPPVEIWLAQALPKGDKLDQIVEKAVELGVKGVFPLLAEHSVVRYDEKKQADKLRRWQKIALEAAQQCGRGIIPTVGPFLTIEQLFAQKAPETNVVVLYEGPGTQGFRSALTKAAGAPLVLAVGPEGGWSPAEAQFFRDRGAFLAGLGPRVLRTETAGIAAIAAIMYESGDLGGI